MSKPSEFYVGVLDLFAVLLPGAIATAILAPRFGGLVIGPLVSVPTSEAGGWAIFLTAAYLLGHLIFLAGSYIDGIYNQLRRRLSPYDNESAYQCAMRVRNSMVDEAERKALNTFQWSRSVLLVKCPSAAEDVHRLEADSKFFRSLLVVLALCSGALAYDGKIALALVALALIPPCFIRYYERRLKSTTQAYIHVVALHRLGQLAQTKPQSAA